ncbi:winged helix-turn-helix domain-containing protein [Burkholderia ubonensis]|uniref:winged helix-turn-helix domain-containing protein n=1 Tax=Burkholderia ubonensis TaxID=101571 RepID=UPI0007C81917|nr:winged helix-turn-helix domain-containing protein [Burkholderia ubonensis]
MTYPHYDELELPLLKLLFEHGGDQHQMRATQTYEPLASYFKLNEVEITQSRDKVLGDGRGEPFWNNMVQWARRKLNENGYLTYAPRGYWKLSELGIEKARALSTGHLSHVAYPDEVPQAVIEGAMKIVAINAYERSTAVRQACIDHYGYRCIACGFDFESKYGERGKYFIHVHHIVPLASIGQSYAVDPIKDLRPVCPNCHAIIHRTDPPCSIEELMKMIRG